jgi:hypothetical protein
MVMLFTYLGIGIEETNAGIGILAYQILVRYQTCSGIVSFLQSGTELTGCRTVRRSRISIHGH